MFGGTLLILAVVCAGVKGLPGGAPNPACANVSPNPAEHNGPPQVTTSPYNLTFHMGSTTQYNPGEAYTCKLLYIRITPCIYIYIIHTVHITPCIYNTFCTHNPLYIYYLYSVHTRLHVLVIKNERTASYGTNYSRQQ